MQLCAKKEELNTHLCSLAGQAAIKDQINHTVEEIKKIKGQLDSLVHDEEIKHAEKRNCDKVILELEREITTTSSTQRQARLDVLALNEEINQIILKKNDYPYNKTESHFKAKLLQLHESLKQAELMLNSASELSVKAREKAAQLKLEELGHRKKSLEVAKQRLNAIQNSWIDDKNNTLFLETKKKLNVTRLEYEKAYKMLMDEHARLQSTARERQLEAFLRSYSIADHKITGIGLARKATLASFGIETAADILSNRILHVPGFGEGLVGELVAWKEQIKRKFNFNPAKGLEPADLALLHQRYGQRCKQLENELLAGHEQLKVICQKATSNRQKIKNKYLEAAQVLAQYEIDYRAYAKYFRPSN